MAETTPLTDLLLHYRALKDSSMASRLEKARETSGAALADSFLSSVAHFASYETVAQPFHGAPTGFEQWHGTTVKYTVDLAKKLALEDRLEAERVVGVHGHPQLAFRYVDRELDCLRRTPGRKLEGGSDAKRAIVLDLLLANAHDGTPVLAEVKIRKDSDAFFALVQVLAAAAHLVTPAQRERLSNVYGLTVSAVGPFVDLYAILYEHPHKGVRVEILRESKRIASELLDGTGVEAFTRRIVFIDAHDAGGEVACTVC